MGRYDEATMYLEESLAIAREQSLQPQIESALSLLGFASLGRGDLASARGYLEEALVLAREGGNKMEVAAAANGLAQFHRLAGQFDAAKPLYEEVLSLALDIGDREIVAVAELNLAMVAITLDVRDDARQLLLHAIAIAKEERSMPTGQSAIEVTAGMAAAQGNWNLAARLFGAAEVQADATGLHRDPADEAFLAPLMLRARERLGEQAFAEAASAGRTLSFDAAIKDSEEYLDRGCRDGMH
jgi:tetratricopeptide (TPR) repeat protein